MEGLLNVAIIQSDLVWHNPDQNRLNFESKIESLTNNVDLIVLPEMFTSGFTMSAATVAETMDGATIQWMLNLAKSKQAAIVGSLVITQNDKFYNRLVFVHPDQTLEHYDKRHTFTLAGEDKVYTKGQQQLIVNYKGFKIKPLVCYDLRFPVWARLQDDYDVLLYVANWPEKRIKAWDTLLQARAIENMSYCIGVNRVGLDANNYNYPGHSAAYTALGDLLTNLPNNKGGVQQIVLTKSHITVTRDKLKFLDDKDTFSLK
ncbi:nitrilase family protein [Olleya sp. YSTF-M6]|uniref:Nitrilase family protein n=1 Tax=Olleya sediminilitoris TaxID=2795739 RepID=A0ABS1WNJ8_9FLAO|nr:nitrilase family protein [Olleya sediminilitoris]MBL7560683.1 nitrilase family protein [Olleya sediminilitoris]